MRESEKKNRSESEDSEVQVASSDDRGTRRERYETMGGGAGGDGSGDLEAQKTGLGFLGPDRGRG